MFVVFGCCVLLYRIVWVLSLFYSQHCTHCCYHIISVVLLCVVMCCCYVSSLMSTDGAVVLIKELCYYD